MFLNSNKKNEKNNQKSIDRNLKMMGLSAVVLIVLFLYTLLKTDTSIQGTSYYAGMIFLFILLILTFLLQKYSDKIRTKIYKNGFSKQLEKAGKEYSQTKTNTKREDEQNLEISPTNSTLSFEDVAGIESVKEELEEIVDFLNNPKKYQKHNISLPKGVLLVGPPGVGKTLIAKAVAGEANVPFFYQSASTFVHIYVGMGAKRVKELFSTAKLNAPSVIFIDEIDAIGKQRGLGSNEEREATLNELLTQMDGFESNEGVMLIAATNKIEVLDEALLRAGRFDRRVFLTLPSKEDRIKILKLYLKDKKHNFDIEKLAQETSGFNSAALATLINESLLNMVKRDGVNLLEDDIEIAKQKIQYGKKQIHILTKNQKNILATYQAGKAFVTKSKVRLFQTGINKKELIYPCKSELIDEIKKYLAGIVSLEVIEGETYIVFEDELKEAYNIATKMVEDYKMSSSAQNLIENIKDNLKDEIIKNVDEIKELKEILLKDEVVF